MLNHFRTLLLNEPYTNALSFIAPGFSSKRLPQDLGAIYSILFPPNVTRNYKHFLVHNYLNLINAAGKTPRVLAFDKRITYNLNDTSFFKTERSSAIEASEEDFVLEVTKGFDTVAFNDYSYDKFVVTQVSNTAVITIFSETKQKYLNGSSEFATLAPDCYITLVRDNSNSIGTYYKEVPIGTSGAYFRIIEPLSGDLTTVSDATWTFSIEGPYANDLVATFNRLEQEHPFRILNSYNAESIADLYKIWELEPNIVFRFAALLIAYVTIINTL